ncbi:Phage Tail Collar Domain [Bartonella grahamii]|nr:Phage Tail Collar Domain [Bartonella grahamii]
MERLPDGWLPCDGRAYSRYVYWDLFCVIGTTWGEGDGVTTFNVPDFRGMFLRGLDNERNLDPWRSFASIQPCS